MIEMMPPLQLPHPGEKTVFFGDSWAQGYSADPETLGYAYLVGQKLQQVTEVDWARQSGFVRLASDGRGTYRDRLLARPVDPDVRLFVLQASVNDLGFRSQARAAAAATMPVVREKFPNAQIVVLGPSAPKSVNIDAIADLSNKVLSAAKAAGFYAISPAGQGWITARNMDGIIDPVTEHPSTHGHAVYAAKVYDAIIALSKDGQQKG